MKKISQSDIEWVNDDTLAQTTVWEVVENEPSVRRYLPVGTRVEYFESLKETPYGCEHLLAEHIGECVHICIIP